MLPDAGLKEIFAQSCREQLTGVESALLDLAQACAAGERVARDVLESVFRAAHSIKADAAAMGLGDIVSLAHALENVLQRLTDGRLSGGEAVQPLLEGFDLLGRLVSGDASAGDAGSGDAAKALAARLESLGAERAVAVATCAADPGEEPDVAPQSGGPDGERRIDRVTVSARSLDDLVDQLAELASCQARIALLAERSGQPELLLAVEEMERAAEIVRARAVDMRLLPLRLIFGRYRRMVHDLARELGREADLVVSGEDVRVDKAALEGLGGVLSHLVRNAVAHGVEPPLAREAAGKPRRGTIRLRAAQEGGEAVIEVADDGAGINVAALCADAEARGLVPPGARLSESQALELVFAPGVSTAAGVSQVSGRGVGMDAVRAAMQAMRGSVELDSEPGQGVTARLRLPLSLSLLECLLVRCGGIDCFLRLDAVEECVDLTGATGTDRALGLWPLRGGMAPLLRVARLFGGHGEMKSSLSGVVVRDRGSLCVLAVEEIVGRRQAVYKRLPVVFGRAPFVQGCSVTDDGRMGLILDVAGLVAFAAAQRGAERPQGG